MFFLSSKIGNCGVIYNGRGIGMKNRKKYKPSIPVLLFFTLFLMLMPFGCKESGITTEIIDGVKHVHNPAEPLKGTIDLELEEILRIDPMEVNAEDFIIFRGFWKDPYGNIYFYDMKTIKAFQFNSDGKFLGSFIRRGRGPGEFPQYTGVYFAFVRDGEIWAKGGFKISRFDMDRNLLGEFKLSGTYSSVTFVDENRFLGKRRQVKEEDEEIQNWDIVTLVEIVSGEKENILTDFFKAKNVGIIRVGKSAFAENWATPNLYCVYDDHKRRIYAALNTEYKISVYELDGKTAHVIDREYNHISLTLKEKNDIIVSIFERPIDYIVKGYPDKLCAIRTLKLLPRGYIAVYSISGIQKYTIDVYDPEGKFLYVLTPPEGLPLEDAEFYKHGFGLKEEKEDRDVYVEYRVKNLPEIFGDR